MIEKTSLFLAKWLAKKRPLELFQNEFDKKVTKEDQIEVYYYSFQAIVGAIVKGFLLISISWLLNVLIESLIVTITFAGLRIWAGGYHMSSYKRCISFSLFMFIGSALIAKPIQCYDNEPIFLLIDLVILMSALIIWQHAPKDTPNNRITDINKIIKYRKISLRYIAIWGLVVLISTYLGVQHKYILSSVLGILIVNFIVSPFGYNFLESIDKIKNEDYN